MWRSWDRMIVESRHVIPMRLVRQRKGYVLIWFALLLVLLLAMVGLVIDVGLHLASYRQTRNATDAAALSAAEELFRGKSFEEAKATAIAFVQVHHGFTNAEVVVNRPPSSGPYANAGTGVNYVEVIVINEVSTFFIHVLPGISQKSTLRARAVAGYEAIAQGEGAIVLDPRARPGLSVDGGGTLIVDGSVVVNARGSGQDQYGYWYDTGYQKHAAEASNNSFVKAGYLQVVGGVNLLENFENIEPGGPHPLFAGAQIAPDPLSDLPIPTAENGADLTQHGTVKVDQSSPKPTYLNPGIYEDILITQGADVILNPGIYILSPAKPNQGLRINGDPTVTGEGVMFYVTGSNYMTNGAGYFDAQDGAVELDMSTEQLLPPPETNFNSVKFARVDINATGATVKLTGLDNPNSPFDDVLFYQRRRNETTVSIQGNAGQNVTLGGTIYAKWARFKLAGAGRYDAQFLVGSMQVSGQATVTINGTGKNFGLAHQVFLVE